MSFRTRGGWSAVGATVGLVGLLASAAILIYLVKFSAESYLGVERKVSEELNGGGKPADRAREGVSPTSAPVRSPVDAAGRVKDRIEKRNEELEKALRGS